MNKDEFLGEINREWQQLLDLVGGFTPEELLQPGAVGHWNVRESLIHVAAWDMELAEIIKERLTTGVERDYGDDEAVNLLNDEQVDEKRDLTSEQVLAHIHQTHQSLLDFIGSLPDSAFNLPSYTGDTMAMETFGHYREHREDLERFKASHQ